MANHSLPSIAELEVFYLELIQQPLSHNALQFASRVTCLAGLSPADLQAKLARIVISLIQLFKITGGPTSLEAIIGSLSAEEAEVLLALSQGASQKAGPEISDLGKTQIENQIKANLIAGEVNLNE
mmetsp:Transcript_5771/g.9185  ORF Transcript_5771/g.9185 Transcript_5771/m.9185 type:complete len:126 (-) Transcript_5771:861-1238(-)